MSKECLALQLAVEHELWLECIGKMPYPNLRIACCLDEESSSVL